MIYEFRELQSETHNKRMQVNSRRAFSFRLVWFHILGFGSRGGCA
jgi:hypothetical protein